MTSLNKKLIAFSAVSLTLLLYKQYKHYFSGKTPSDIQTTTGPRTVAHFTSALLVYNTSKIYTHINTLLTLPNICQPFHLSSIFRITASTCRAFFYAGLYTIGSFKSSRHVPTLVSSILAAFHSSIQTPPQVQFTSEVEASTATHRLNIERGQGLLHAQGIESHQICLFVKTTAKTNWDEHLTSAPEQDSNSSSTSSGSSSSSSSSSSSTDPTQSTPTRFNPRHLRKCSGLTWKCELCGERSVMHSMECPICGAIRPLNPPQKGDLEEQTPTKVPDDEERTTAEHQRQQLVQEQARRRARSRAQSVESVATSPSPSSSTRVSPVASPTSTTFTPPLHRVHPVHPVQSTQSPQSPQSPSTHQDYAIVNMVLLCPMHVTSMDVGRLYGSIMTIFAALEQFSDGALKKCTATPKLINAPENETRYEIVVTFAVRTDVVDLSSSSQAVQYTMNALGLEEMEMTTSIRTDSWHSIFNNTLHLNTELAAMDHVFDRLHVTGSSLHTSAATIPWSTAMLYILSTVPSAIASEVLVYNLRWPRIPQCIQYLHELTNDLYRWGMSQNSIAMVFNIIQKQWKTMKPGIDQIYSITVSSSQGSFGMQCQKEV